MDFHDRVSSLSHLGTAAWAAFATLVLLRLTRGHGVGRAAVGAYGASMVLLYLASGVFHGVRYDYRGSPTFVVFQKLDQSAIFLLIAGSYLPIFVYLLQGVWRVVCTGVMLGLAGVGIGALWLLPAVPIKALVVIYVTMGVVGLVALPKYAAVIGRGGMAWVGVLAFFYLAGAAAELFQWPVVIPGVFGYHEVLHVSDTAGTLAHFVLVVKYVIRRPPVRDASRPPGGVPSVLGRLADI